MRKDALIIPWVLAVICVLALLFVDLPEQQRLAAIVLSFMSTLTLCVIHSRPDPQ